ncbi:YheC/YheD family protein [Marinicrinis lubricantis]|uniref:YheC/YheD family protein n=1 Tax=Marinicrinis lubricantis TaxID=2086470 RepID=A0ABW1IIS1_9BACL
MELHNQSAARPLLGIVTTPASKRIFRGNLQNFEEIIRTGNRMGYSAYVITIDKLRLDQEKIQAYSYILKRKTWKTVKIPLPYVLYNRVPYRKHEEMTHVRSKLDECLKQPHTKMYNPSFFYKSSLMDWLLASKLTKPYVPQTVRYNEKMDLRKYVSKHGTIYLKPEKGKAGSGIMRLQKASSNKGYLLHIQEKKQTQFYKLSSWSQVKDTLNEYIKEKAYIVQQGIELAKYKSRPFDLRVLVQKNGKGLWTVTGIGARIAGEASITTHVPRGGSIGKPIQLLQASFGKAATKKILIKVKKTSVFIAKQIEKASGHRLGEMSMDLGIDRNENLWFFEANSKPMKFDEKEIRNKSLEQLFQYSSYLARKIEANRSGSHAMAGS